MSKDEEPLFAFVLMPFNPEFDDVYKFGIKEPAATLKIRAERVDEQKYQEGILERIYRQIDAADIIIADMSGQNPNVFYEVGYAHAKDKICILLTSDAEDIPFDLKHRRHVVYNDSINTLRSQILEELQWAKKENENIKKSHIRVTAKSISGDLEKTKYFAYGKLECKIDLHNDSTKTSPEIEAIYVYTGKAWKITQNGQDCPSTESDIKPNQVRHFLNPPVRKLMKGQWAQLTYNMKKTMANTINGEELKDSYPVRGTKTIRLVTSEGNFDYEIKVDTTVDEFPF